MGRVGPGRVRHGLGTAGTLRRCERGTTGPQRRVRAPGPLGVDLRQNQDNDHSAACPPLLTRRPIPTLPTRCGPSPPSDTVRPGPSLPTWRGLMREQEMSIYRSRHQKNG